jgi:hypothetical protein
MPIHLRFLGNPHPAPGPVDGIRLLVLLNVSESAIALRRLRSWSTVIFTEERFNLVLDRICSAS